MEVKEISRTNPEFLEEMRNWFPPKPEVVKKLPNPREARENQSVYLEVVVNGVTELVEYTMLKGQWFVKQIDDNKNVKYVKEGGQVPRTTPVADGTYTLGLGTTDGTITIVNGIITSIQEVVA